MATLSGLMGDIGPTITVREDVAAVEVRAGSNVSFAELLLLVAQRATIGWEVEAVSYRPPEPELGEHVLMFFVKVDKS